MPAQEIAAAVVPTSEARTVSRPVAASDVRINNGFWHSRQRLNRTRTLPHGATQLRRANNVGNFAAVAEGGEYRTRRPNSGATFPYLDSDLYKWLEAAGWELGNEPDAALASEADEIIELIERAQRADGYLNTFVQLQTPGNEFQDLQWAHELYCAGHLFQAAVAWHRSLADDRLLSVAQRCADRIDEEFGSGRRPDVDGHPEIEMALVELYRVTGARRYLDLAAQFVDARGHGRLGAGRFGSHYWQDHLPVRQAEDPAGHAVRQLYLDCGAVDLAVEIGDMDLLAAVVRRWENMLRSQTYLNGGVGSHHRDESFGEPYELPPDRAYAETCAAIASVMLSWRLLLATGEARFADLAERTIYNAVLPSLAQDAVHFFYVNPLHRRSGHLQTGPGANSAVRAEWFDCACCPPNLMRVFSSLGQCILTHGRGGLELQQYTACAITTELPGGRVQLDVATDYPWDGAVAITVNESFDEPWSLSLRVPSWARDHEVSINGQPVAVTPVDGYVSITRRWAVHDQLALALAMPAQVVAPDRRLDAVRGCVAVQRGPLLYCLEEVDLPSGVAMEDVEIADASPEVVPGSPLPDVPVTVRVEALGHDAEERDWPYRATEPPFSVPVATQVRSHWTQDLVPYFAWGNREPGAMRVWIPTSADD